MSDAGGGMAEDPVCPHAPSIDANDLGTKDCSSARKKPLEPKHVWSIRVRLEIAGLTWWPLDHEVPSSCNFFDRNGLREVGVDDEVHRYRLNDRVDIAVVGNDRL